MIKKGDWVKCPEYSSLESKRKVRFTPGRMYKVIQVQEGDPDPLFGPFFILWEDGEELIVCNTRKDTCIGGEDWIICSFEENLKRVLEGE